MTLIRSALVVAIVSLACPATVLGQSADDATARLGRLIHATTAEMAQNWSMETGLGATHQRPEGITSPRLSVSFMRNCGCGASDITRLRFLIQGSVMTGEPERRVRGAETAVDLAASYRLWWSLTSSLRATAFEQLVRAPRNGFGSRNVAGATVSWTRTSSLPNTHEARLNVYAGAGRSEDRGVAIAGATAEVPLSDKLTVVFVQSYTSPFSRAGQYRLGTMAEFQFAAGKSYGFNARYAFEFDRWSSSESRRTASALTLEFLIRFKSPYPVYLI